MWDNQIINIIELSKKIPDSQKVFEKRTGKLRHKLDALKYHSLNFKNEEDRLIKQYQISYVAENIHYALENPTLIYNTESFLFQTKSCLDVLSQIIALAYGIKEIRQGYTIPLFRIVREFLNTWMKSGLRLSN